MGASFFALAEAVSLAGVKRQPLSRRLEKLGLLQERISEEGHNKGQAYKVIAAADLFRVYPAAQAAWEAQQRRQAMIAELDVPPPPAIAPPADPAAIQILKDWQRRRMDARLAILRHWDHLVLESGSSREQVLSRLLWEAQTSTLPEEIQALLPMANARSGQSGDRTLSRRTLQRWASEARAGFDRLAPKASERATPSWAPMLLELYRRPQAPSLRHVVLDMLPGALPAGQKPPTYDAARRFLDKVGALEREKGRKLDRELKTLKPFRRREKPEFPFDILTADGHTFDAEIAHPEHGRPFRPELTMVVDVATSRIVGWSAWEKESSWSVLDAFRMAVLTGGIPLLFYTDNGPGYRNERLEALQTRLGYKHSFSIPYNSQARGVVERLQKTVWVDLAAKAFDTYVGAAMDRQARQIVYKASRKGEPIMPTWQTFVVFVEAIVAAYNARPSRACPKALDDQTGRMRHLSPDETWARAESMGWTPVGLPLSLEDFRPEELRQVRRGEISLFGNTYFSRELAELHGEQVRVAFDIHDASRVWIRREDGTLVCEAGFEANKSAYFPKPYVESLREQRREGQRQRLEAKAQRVLGEPLDRPRVEVQELTERERALAAESFAALPDYQPTPEAASLAPSIPTPASGRPAFPTDLDYLRWAQAHPEELDPQEAREIHLRLEADPALQAVLGMGA